MSRAPWMMTAAAAATIGADADVPPESTGIASCGVQGYCVHRCARATMLSEGAAMSMREPNPDENDVAPLKRVSGNWPTRDSSPPACGGALKMSSSVVPPTAMAPLSWTRVATVEAKSSAVEVGVSPGRSRSVGALPPSGPTAVGVKSRVPSFEEMQTTIPCATIPAMTDCPSGSSSRYRPGYPTPSKPNPRLAVMTSGRGCCVAAAWRAA